MLLDKKGEIMSSEPEQDARVQELADVIIPRIAGAMRQHHGLKVLGVFRVYLASCPVSVLESVSAVAAVM